MSIYYRVNRAVNSELIRKRFREELKHKNETFRPEYQVTRDMKKEHIAYLKSKGFARINPDFMAHIVSVNGQYDKRYIPDDIFNVYMDRPYHYAENYWKDKAYQHKILPFVRFPETIVRNVNGYYLDNDDNLIDEKIALRSIRNSGRVVIKPALFNGGGLNVNFFDGDDVNDEILNGYGRDFVVQKKIEQSEYMASLNKNSVTTDKIASYFFNGEVYIVGAFLRISDNDVESDNVFSSNYGCFLHVNNDGTTNNIGYGTSIPEYGSYWKKTFTGIDFKDIKLDFHKDCIDIITKAHKRLLYFPFISWDFAQDKTGEPILIEYNMKWHRTLDYQYGSGPLFGDMTDEILDGFRRWVR